MARFPRVVATGVPHHITQRGNNQSYLLDSDPDREVYLRLLLKYSRQYDLTVHGYCLMSNHVHLVATPNRDDSLSRALKNTHGRYAAYFNARRQSSGHAWQGRFYSCPLATDHLWSALRYVELNPVRAGLVDKPQLYQWSSAPAHCHPHTADPLLDTTLFDNSWDAPAWRLFLRTAPADAELSRLRLATHTGRPLGEAAFVSGLELSLGRDLTPKPTGRPPRRPLASAQAASQTRLSA